MISIRKMLHAAIAGMEKDRCHMTVHASDLTKELEFCPRELRLMDATGRSKPDQFIPTSLRVTFDYGNFLQWCINNKYLRSEMWGHWKCLSCGKNKKKQVQKVPSKTCSLDAKCRWEYREPKATDPTTGIEGNIDGLVMDGKKLRMLEIKTVVRDDFKKLVAPLSEHRHRSELYLWLASRDPVLSKIIHLDHLNLLYVCKGYGVKDRAFQATLRKAGISDWPYTPYKEFVIQSKTSGISTVVKKGYAVKVARDQKTMPPGICGTAMCKRARECAMRTACFSGKYPATSKRTW